MGAALLACGVPACSSGAPGFAHGATVCAYPAGPYGTKVGDVVDPSLQWQGYVNDSGQSSNIAISDYYDCDGTKGVTALLLDESATWCSDCANETSRIAPEITSSWRSSGVQVITLMNEDQQQNPATLDTALSWRNEYALTAGAVCADPKWTTKLWGGASGSGNGLPTNVLVDPRTMKIVAIQPGDLDGTVKNLAAANR
jgi:hypothetical protein